MAVGPRYVTYGSACQDCGFNNQRVDLEEAARLAKAHNRTLVVRNFVCSPHSPCPSKAAITMPSSSACASKAIATWS